MSSTDDNIFSIEPHLVSEIETTECRKSFEEWAAFFAALRTGATDARDARQRAILTLSVDSGPLCETLESVLGNPLKVPQEAVNRFIRDIEAGAQVFRMDTDRSAAAGANQIRVTLQPSDRLLELVAAKAIT